MEKKNYYTPEVKFHKLRTKAVMQTGSVTYTDNGLRINPDGDTEMAVGEEAGAKGLGFFRPFTFDKDEY